MATAEFSKFADILNKASGSDRIPGELLAILKNDAVSPLHHPKLGGGGDGTQKSYPMSEAVGGS